MKRDEAIQAMKEGHKITHTYFSPDEYLFMEDEIISSEDGVCWGYYNNPNHFEGTCLDPDDKKFNDGWEIFENLNTPTYTPEQIKGRFISCTVLITGKRPVLDAVRYSRGPYVDMPVLYNSITEAKEDQFWDDDCDEVLPAEEYFRRANAQVK